MNIQRLIKLVITACMGTMMMSSLEGTSPTLAHAFTILSLSQPEMSNDKKKEEFKKLMLQNPALLYEKESAGNRNLLQGSALRNDKPMYEFFAQQMNYPLNFEEDVKREQALEAQRLAGLRLKYPEKMKELAAAEKKLKEAEDSLYKIKNSPAGINTYLIQEAQKIVNFAREKLAEIQKDLEKQIMFDSAKDMARQDLEKAQKDYDAYLKQRSELISTTEVTPEQQEKLDAIDRAENNYRKFVMM